MPFTDIPAGKKVRFSLEIRGPRDAVQGKRFKKALFALLKKNATVMVRQKKRR